MHSEIVEQGKHLTFFLAYAHADEPLLQELETHLSQLRQQESHIRWNKQRSGIEWAKVNNERLEQAYKEHEEQSDRCPSQAGREV